MPKLLLITGGSHPYDETTPVMNEFLAEAQRLREIRGGLAHDEAGDAAGARSGVGHRGDHEDLPYPTVGNEDLAAADPVSSRRGHRPGPGPGGVRTRTGLGKTESSEHLARGQQRQEPGLLRLRPEGQDG